VAPSSFMQNDEGVLFNCTNVVQMGSQVVFFLIYYLGTV